MLKIIFSTDTAEPDIGLDVREETVQSLTDKIREIKGWSSRERLRIIAAGRELGEDEVVSADRHPVIHCLVVHGADPSASGHPHSRANFPRHPPRDWLDAIDPGTALMWVFGGILALSWGALALFGNVFDGASVIMLCTMTAAFLFPYLLPYIPLPSACRPPTTQQQQAYPPGYTFVDGPMGDRVAVPPRPGAPIIGPAIAAR